LVNVKQSLSETGLSTASSSGESALSLAEQRGEVIMQRFVGSLLLLCVGLLSAGCQKFKGEPTLTPPSGWKEASFAGAKKVWAGPAANGFAPNINIVE